MIHFPKCLEWPKLGQSETGVQEFLLSLPCGCRFPRPRAIPLCFPWRMSRRLYVRWSSRDLNHPPWDAGTTNWQLYLLYCSSSPVRFFFFFFQLDFQICLIIEIPESLEKKIGLESAVYLRVSWILKWCEVMWLCRCTLPQAPAFHRSSLCYLHCVSLFHLSLISVVFS